MLPRKATAPMYLLIPPYVLQKNIPYTGIKSTGRKWKIQFGSSSKCPQHPRSDPVAAIIISPVERQTWRGGL